MYVNNFTEIIIVYHISVKCIKYNSSESSKTTLIIIKNKMFYI
jgi:hypothetical protein